MAKSTDHTSYFTDCRNECINKVASQTNNLIIRLDKLINRQSGDEEISRKEYEKRVVPWSENAEFPNCRVCSAKFSLTRRKHHCRLCGKIMCHSCSLFLPFSSARKLTGPEFAQDVRSATESPDQQQQQRNGDKSLVVSRMGMGSLQFVKSQLGSIIGSGAPQDSNAAKEEPQDLRICDVCKRLLDRREEAMDLRTSHSVFVDIYQKLCHLLTQISNLAPSYKNMAESLNAGESIYSLEAAAELRKKMVSVQREIASLSERIEHWGMEEDPLVTRRPDAREVILQRNIKMLAVGALHDALSTMPDLPTEERYEELKAEHRERLIRQREAEERERELQASQQSTLRSFPSNPAMGSSATAATAIDPADRRSRASKLKPSASLNVMKNDDGWVSNSPFQYNPFQEEQLNAVQQQYLNIKSYLQQAAQAGRLDEVEILEAELKVMEEELKRCSLPTPRLVD